MPQVDQVQVVHRKSYAVVIVAVLVVVLVAAVVVYIGWRLVPSAATTVKEADALDAQGKYNAAFGKLQPAYARAFTASDKELILSRMAATKADAGDNRAALDYYQQLNKLKPNDLGTLLSIADIAERAGDKTTAIQAYQQAVDYEKAQPQTIRTKQALDQWNAKIAELQK